MLSEFGVSSLNALDPGAAVDDPGVGLVSGAALVSGPASEVPALLHSDCVAAQEVAQHPARVTAASETAHDVYL